MKKFNRYLNKHYWLRKFLLSKISNLFFSDKTHRKAIFRHIFSSNHWRDYNKPNENKSVSGKGSDLRSTKIISEELILFFKSRKIQRILDIGCGDFLWMKSVLAKFSEYDCYLGLDIVPELIDQNKKNFSNDKINFNNFDIVIDELPNGFDIILIRDVFIHLNNKSINHCIQKLIKSDAQFIGITSTPSIKNNKDLKKEGRYRDINIETEPFNLKSPLICLSDNEVNGEKKDFLNIYKNK